MRRDRARRRRAPHRRGPPRAPRRALPPPAPWQWRPTGRALASPIRSTSSRAWPGSREPDGSWMRTREAPSSPRWWARSSSTSVSPAGPGLCTSPTVSSLPAARMASAASLEVAEVVERIVEPEDVDPAGGRALDEAADEVPRDWPRPHEETPAQRHPERRRAPRADRPNALPRALHPAAHRAVETPAAGDLEVGEAGLVEHGPQARTAGRPRPGRRAAPARGAGSSCRRAAAPGYAREM